MTALLQMLNAFWGIKNKLTQLWVDPSMLQNVDFNDPYALNDLASKIMPNLLKANPQVASQIKQQAKSFVPDKEAEIIEMVGN